MRAMVITGSSLKGIQCKSPQGLVVVDAPSRVEGGITLQTYTQLPISREAPGLIYGPGEYEIAEVVVRGLDANGRQESNVLRSVYVVDCENMRLCFLGALTKELSSEVVDKIGEIDILFVVRVDKELLAAKNLAGLIRTIDPHVVVVLGGRKDAQGFADEWGQKFEEMEKLTIRKKDISEENTRLIWMKEK